MKNKRILFFDDEKFTSESLIKNLVDNYGYNIHYVSKLTLLFDELHTKHYDLIILDIMAPIPDNMQEKALFSEAEIMKMCEGSNTGVVVAEKIWSLEEYLDIPILFITAKRVRPNFTKPKTAIIRKPELAATISEEIQKLLA
jgi:CheY-like chemotaxis protein